MFKILLIAVLILLVNIAYSQSFKIVGNSRLAKLAGRIVGRQKYAVTLGQTIFVSCDKQVFLSEGGWVRHELTHVEQYKRFGTFEFLKRYLLYSMFHRYAQNPFEKVALSAEALND